MALLDPTKPTKRKSRAGSPITPSPAHSSTALSPELLQTVQALRTRIEELESERELNKADRDELKTIRAELAALKAAPENPSKDDDGPHTEQRRKPLSAGWF